MFTTSRLGLEGADGTTAVSGYPAIDLQAKTILDGSVLYSEGTLASRPTAAIKGRFYKATDTGVYYWDSGSAWLTVDIGPSRGASIVATSQTYTSATPGTLATPDQVSNVVLGSPGIIEVLFQATWQESVSGTAGAFLYLNSTPLALAAGSQTAPINLPAGIGKINTAQPLSSYPGGLWSAGGFTGSTTSLQAYSGDVTSGQVVGVLSQDQTPPIVMGGPCKIFAAAGTYTVSVRFVAVAGGTVTVSNRRLYAKAENYS